MADPTALTLEDYQVIEYALRDYVQMLEEAVEDDMLGYWAGCAPPSKWIPDLQVARAVKRKIRRRMGRLEKVPILAGG